MKNGTVIRDKRPSVLITDTLFIFPKHEELLENAGYKVVRVETPNCTEAELGKELKGKVGYILGGVENVTSSVIESATDLKAISFTGTEWKEHIPAWQEAANRGISIANTPYTNHLAVAEWHFSVGVSMVRNVFELGGTGNKKFETVKGFSELQVGIVGLGHVGAKLADLFNLAGFQVVYWSRGIKTTNYKRLELNNLLRQSDIVCFCVSAEAGEGYIDRKKLSLMKNDAIVTATTQACVDESALLSELKAGRLRSYLDFTPKTKGYKHLPPRAFYCSNVKTSYNTSKANTITSDMAVNSLINMLSSGEDQNKVN